MSIHDPRVLDTDPVAGIVEFFHYDADTDGFTIETQQDVEPFIELNKAQYNNAPDYRRYGGEHWFKVASIPSVVIMELSKQGILSPAGAILDDARFRRWLNDRDNLLFRTRPGKV